MVGEVVVSTAHTALGAERMPRALTVAGWLESREPKIEWMGVK